MAALARDQQSSVPQKKTTLEEKDVDLYQFVQPEGFETTQKPSSIQKSALVLDIKPRDVEVDLHELENKVRSIKADGLVWGDAKNEDIAFGISKLEISCIVEDDKIGTDWLEEQIKGRCGDLVQSIDIVAFSG